MAAFIVDRIVRAHLKTMARLNVSYDLLTYEGDILRLRFWAHAFEILKAQGAVFLQTEGKLAGCWVMRIEEGARRPASDRPIRRRRPSPAEPAEARAQRGERAREKVIVRSNGVVTYVGKDIANQFWKFGLLGRDFRYRRFSEQANGKRLWATTSTEGEPGAPPFGHARRIYNVIDSRQMYLQALLSQALRTLGHRNGGGELGPLLVRDGGAVACDGTRTRLSRGARRGEEAVRGGFRPQGTRRQDRRSARPARATRRPSRWRSGTRSSRQTTRGVSRARLPSRAIRYFMLKFSRGKLIVFDIEEALSFEGETGPYLQYAVVRANNIFQKLKEREGLTEADVLAATRLDRALTSSRPSRTQPSGLWRSRPRGWTRWSSTCAVARVLRAGQVCVWTRPALQRVLSSVPDSERRERRPEAWRAAGVAYFRSQLTRALDLMGIDVPTRM